MRYAKLIAALLCIAAFTLCTTACRDVTDVDFPQKETSPVQTNTEAGTSLSTVGGADSEEVITEEEIVLESSVNLSAGTVESYLQSKNLKLEFCHTVSSAEL